MTSLSALFAGAFVVAMLVVPRPAAAHAPICPETWNPATNPQHWTAVPGGYTTFPGTNPNGPQNSDGFFLIDSSDAGTRVLLIDGCPGTGDGGTGEVILGPETVPFTVKYTEANGKDPDFQLMAGSISGNPKSDYIYWHVWGQGDLYVCVEGAVENGVVTHPDWCTCCPVPPPPF